MPLQSKPADGGPAPEDLVKEVTWRQLTDGELDVRRLAESVTLEDVELLRVGTWNGDRYSLSDLEDMVAAYERVGYMPPVKLGHAERQQLLQADGLPAAGWVSKLAVVGDRLIGTLKDVPRKIAELIKRGAYRTLSSEVYFNRRLEDGSIVRRALRAVSLLGAEIPAVKGLTPLDAYLKLYADPDDGENLHVAGVELHTNTEPHGGTKPMPEPDKGGAPAVTAEDLKKLTDQLAELKTSIDSKDEKIAKLESQLTVERTSRLSEEVTSFIDRAKRAGKLAPAEEPLARIILESADRTKTAKYTDGDQTVEITACDAVKKFILSRPDAFKVLSEDRQGGRDNPDAHKYTEYDMGQGKTVRFDETAADAARVKALSEGKTPQEAYQAYERAGLAGGDR